MQAVEPNRKVNTIRESCQYVIPTHDSESVSPFSLKICQNFTG